MQTATLLTLDDAALEAIRGALRERVTIGLARDGAEIRALPAFLPPPPRGLSGKAMVVDCGGTNIRAALVDLDPAAGPKVLVESRSERILDIGRDDPSGDAFFALQAELLRSIVDAPGLPLGYCFSFPATCDSSRDAKLIHFTKDLDIPGIEGTWVGRRLSGALASRGIGPSRLCVLNDTVAALIGGAGVYGSEAAPPARFMGLIVGTGTNIAGFFSAKSAPKLSADMGTMAINLETASFSPPHLTPLDDAVDRASELPGNNRYEKALSGRYLPHLMRAAAPDAGIDPKQGTGPVVELRDSPEARPEHRAIARAILDRSADLVAAGLAAVIDHYTHGAKITVLAEGSVMWKSPGYSARVEGTLRRLLDGDARTRGQAVDIAQLEHVNLFGAAYAALTP